MSETVAKKTEFKHECNFRSDVKIDHDRVNMTYRYLSTVENKKGRAIKRFINDVITDKINFNFPVNMSNITDTIALFHSVKTLKSFFDSILCEYDEECIPTIKTEIKFDKKFNDFILCVSNIQVPESEKDRKAFSQMLADILRTFWFRVVQGWFERGFMESDLLREEQNNIEIHLHFPDKTESLMKEQFVLFNTGSDTELAITGEARDLIKELVVLIK